MEVWVDLKNCEGYYQISNYGMIRSIDRILDRKGNSNRKDHKVFKKSKNIKWLVNGDGYLYLYLVNSYTKNYFVSCHREVAKAFIENPENKPEVNHKDGNKFNNHVDNLEWSTRLENMRHAMDNGLNDSRGEKCGMSKLTESEVISIRASYTGKFGELSKLGRQYKVSSKCIEYIVKRETWKHI